MSGIQMHETLKSVRTEQRLAILESACHGNNIDATTLLSSLDKAAVDRPDILRCNPLSIMECLIVCAKLDLDPTGEHNSAWLIPYRENLSVRIGYGGYISLICRGDWIKIDTHAVYEGEHFVVEAGTEDRIEHTPDFEIRNQNPLTIETAKAAYAIATHRCGIKKWAVIDRHRIIRARQHYIDSKRANQRPGPWETDTAAMILKTPIRELAKTMQIDRLGQLATKVSDEGDGYSFDPSKMRQVKNTASDLESQIETLDNHEGDTP